VYSKLVGVALNFKNSVANLVLAHISTQNNSSSPAKTTANSGPTRTEAEGDEAIMHAENAAGERGESGGGDSID